MGSTALTKKTKPGRNRAANVAVRALHTWAYPEGARHYTPISGPQPPYSRSILAGDMRRGER
eukprot:9150220-Prorocentrum_lima.AAC.1